MITTSNKAIYLVATILIICAVMLMLFVQLRSQDHFETQYRLGSQAVKAASTEIQRYIDNQRHLALLFSKVESKTIARLASDPTDSVQHQYLQSILNPFLPEAHNYTIADQDGIPLLPDDGKMIGRSCRTDLLAYASGNRKNTVFIHSNPEPSGYHFDILADTTDSNDFRGIFFVSLNTLILSDILKNFQLPGHQLFLSRPEKDRRMIELSSEGPRPELKRDFYLSKRELESSLYSLAIPGTYWTLNDIPQPDLFSDYLLNKALQAIVAWLIFFTICAVMLWRITIESRHRVQAEKELREARDQLQQAVIDRTSELEHSRDELYHQAMHDSLTGLINRKAFDNCIDKILHTSNVNHSAVLAYLDLDQFKLINDSCGHLAGDELLKQVVKHIHSSLRESDDIGRLGGDEFGVILQKCPMNRAIDIMENVIATLAETPFQWKDKAFYLNVSIGLTEINSHSTSSTELLRQADLACYVAKDMGRGRIHVYSGWDSESNKRNQELDWLSDIPNMINNNNLLLYIQPIRNIVSADTSEHFEVLLRLKGQDNQIIPPGEIIPAAERYNLMTGIDRWVIENAFAFMADIERSDGQKQLRLSINLSANSVSDKSLIEYIQQQQHTHSISAENITFELTETSAISILAKARAFIVELQGLGYRFALDDFGSGVASFEYLKQLPVDYLKIDGSFIVNIVDDPVNQALVRAMTQAAHALGKKVVAEFVEDEASLAMIKSIGVDLAQGYYFGKPDSLRSRLERPQHNKHRAT